MPSFDTTTLIVWGATFAALLSVAAVGLPFLQTDKRSSRLKMLSKEREELSRKQMEEVSTGSAARRQAKKPAQTEMFKKILKVLKLEEQLSSDVLKQQLANAGFRGQAVLVIYVFARFAMAIGVALATFVFVVLYKDLTWPFYAKMGGVALAGVIGFYLPRVIVSNMAQGRQQEMNKAFPDTLDLLVICVESGLGIETAFERVTEEIAESSPILAREFGLTSAELAYIGERGKAYENFAKRTGLPAAKALATTLMQSDQYGTPIGGALKVLSQERRDDRMAIAEKKGAALPAKLTVPMIVFFLPVLFLVVLGPAVIQIVRMD